MNYTIVKEGGNVVVKNKDSQSVLYTESSGSTHAEIRAGELHLRDRETHRNKGVFPVTSIYDSDDVAYTEETLDVFLRSILGDPSRLMLDEMKKQTSYNTPGQAILENTTQVYSGFKSLAVEILEGTGIITVGDDDGVTFPIASEGGGSVSGALWTVDTAAEKDVTIDVSSGKAYVNFVV